MKEGENMAKNKMWEKVGVVGVDSGLIWLGDPCYIIHSDDKNPDLGENWSEFCKQLYPDDETHPNDGVRQWTYGIGRSGLGVTVGTGWGDGVYDVVVQKDSSGRIMRVMIDFDPPEEEVWNNEGFDYNEEEEEDWCESCGEPYEYCECDNKEKREGCAV